MAANDLTSLAAAKLWLALDPAVANPADGQIAQLVTAWSRAVASFVSVPILSQTFNDRYDGNGGSRIMLRQFPVTSVLSLAVDNVAVPASAIPAAGATTPNGWLLDPWDGSPPGRSQSLDLMGCYGFTRGRQNIAVSYVAGYLISGEAATIPGTPYKVTVAGPNGPWGADGGVTFVSNGAALTKVASNPSAGQYAIDTTLGAAAGTYVFAAADTGKAVLISYSYVPADLAQVVNALVGEDFRYKSRIGETSKSLGGQETMAYSQVDIPPRYKTILMPYRNVLPV